MMLGETISKKRAPNIALVHDYLLQDGGGERVLKSLQDLYPEAPTYTLFYDKERAHGSFRHRDIRVSELQKWPFVNGRESWALPFMPMATEHIDLSGFDVVISSSNSFAKGVITAPGAFHLCYLHTPARFLWEDRVRYVHDLALPRMIKRLLPHFLFRLRQWDRLAAERPDVILTNSQTSRARIRRYYGREADVLYPPVDISGIPKPTKREGRYWLTGGRLVGYKRFDLTVRAFAKMNVPLKIFGVGPELNHLKKIAGPKTEFLGHVTDEQKIHLYHDAIGFIHPQVEDFGITAIEAMASGKPVIAYGEGGASETVLPGVTGEHLEAQTWADIGNAVIRFDASKYDPDIIRKHAERFSTEQFHRTFEMMLDHLLSLRSAYDDI